MSHKLKIAILNILYYPDIVGGAEISTQKLAEELAKTNDVYVICHGENTEIDEIINGVHVIRMPVRNLTNNKISRAISWCYNFRCYKQLKEILLYISPDLLHTNNLQEFSVIAWKVASDLKIPIVHTIRDYMLLPKYRLILKLVNKQFSKKVNIVTAPSQFTLNKFISNDFFKAAIIRKSVPNAIDIDYSALMSIQNIKEKRNDVIIKFAYIGRYSPEKGVDWLIRCFSEMKLNAELHLYGKGNLTENSKKLIKSCENIVEHGFLSQESLSNALQDMDVVIVPSLWDEPFGRTILDGYKALCPVIVTNRGGMPEIIVDKKTGIILEEETDECLKNAIMSYMERSKIIDSFSDIKEKLNSYTLERQVNTFMKLYHEII